MKKFYKIFCKAEEFIAMLFLTTITGLIFISAVARTVRHPINWAMDLSLLLFAWLVFFSADVALRKADFISVDVLADRLPPKVRKILYYLLNTVILLLLGLLIAYSIPLCTDNAKRLFQTLGISYSWATASVGVGSLLLSITTVLKMIGHAKEDFIKQKEAKS